MNVIEAKGLHKAYGDTRALAGFDLVQPRQSLVAIDALGILPEVLPVCFRRMLPRRRKNRIEQFLVIGS